MADAIPDKDNLNRLTDGELFKACKRFGLNPGPVTSTTRSVYEKRLRKALESQPTVVMATSRSTQSATPDTSLLDQTQQEQQREAETLAKLKLEQTRLAKAAAERDLEMQRQLELHRELERQRELDREREKLLERERERERERELAAQKEREKAAERERERLRLLERERAERERAERERVAEQKRRAAEAAERERAEQLRRIEAIEREKERERAERLEQQRRMETAASRARQQSNLGGASAIPVRVAAATAEPAAAATTLNKENLLYPNLNNLERPASGGVASSRYQPFKQPFSDATSGYGPQNGGLNNRRDIKAVGLKATKNVGKGVTDLDDDVIIYPQANSTMMKDAARMSATGGPVTRGGIDVAAILGEPKSRSSICPPSVSATVGMASANPTIGSHTAAASAGGHAPTSSLVNPVLASISNAPQAGISPIRDKWAERLSQHGILRDTNNTLYTSTLSSPTGIRGRQPLHTGSDKPLLTSTGSVSSTSSDLYNQQPDFGGKSGSSSSGGTQGKSFIGNFFQINYTYAILCLMATVVVYLIFMQLQPNPVNPIDF